MFLSLLRCSHPFLFSSFLLLEIYCFIFERLIGFDILPEHKSIDFLFLSLTQKKKKAFYSSCPLDPKKKIRPFPPARAPFDNVKCIKHLTRWIKELSGAIKNFLFFPIWSTHIMSELTLSNSLSYIMYRLLFLHHTNIRHLINIRKLLSTISISTSVTSFFFVFFFLLSSTSFLFFFLLIFKFNEINDF